MARSTWKLNYLSKSLTQTISPNKVKTIWTRDSIIPFNLLDYTVRIHNGKDFKTIKINKEKIGFKFGEFAPTRKTSSYKGKKKY